MRFDLSEDPRSNLEDMKNILITTGIFPPDIGGPASYAVTLGKNAPEGNKITVITYSSVLNHPNDKNLPFKVIRVWRKLPWGIRHYVYFLKVLSEAKKNDVILSLNAVSAGKPAMMAARMKKKKFFVKVVGDYAWEIAINKNRSSLLINDFQDAVKKGFINTLAKTQEKVCKNADGVIVPSKYLAGMVKKWGVESEKIHTIYNGVDFKGSEMTKEEARKKIGIPGNIIVSSGRMVPWKGFKMLIKIMPKILEINPFLRLVIIGDGPERKLLESMVKNMNLDRKVYLVGQKSKEDMAVYFAAADMFVLNSGYEGFSHQILEAMSAGVPVIASAVGGNKEVIEQGRNGFLVKYNDEFNLIEAIKGLHQSQEIKDEFAAAGRETVMKYSFGQMIEKTFKLLNE
jgi:glycosyltransferase involved in cell wall biosynthesis